MRTGIIQAEWIGRHISIVEAPNPSQRGIEGTLVDETKNMLVIETARGLKRVPKHGAVFQLDDSLIEGDRVLCAPEDRIKLKVSG